MALSSDNLNYPDFFPKKKKANGKQTLISTDPVESKRRGSKGIDYHKSTISMILISFFGNTDVSRFIPAKTQGQFQYGCLN